MENFKLLNLRLFDGGAATGAAVGGEGAGNGVGSQTMQNVVYGKSTQENEGQEGGQNNEGVADQTNETEQSKVTLKSLLNTNPEIKTELEGMIQRRIKNSKAELESANARLQSLDPILTTLFARYGIKEGDMQGLQTALQRDTSYLEEEAELKGMTVEQLAYVKQLEAQNMAAQRQQRLSQEQMYKQQLQARWDSESMAVKELYPDFDFATEINSNETFEKLIRANFPVKDAYEFAHRQEIEAAKQTLTAQEVQKQITSNIKARQERPQEAGLKGQSGFIAKTDPSQLTSKDIKEIRRRVANGEKISF